MGVELVEVTEVTPLGGWRLHLTFSDGFSGDLDLSYLASTGGVFAPLRDPEFFAQVRLDPELGTITWPNGADLAPEVLRLRTTGKTTPPPRKKNQSYVLLPVTATLRHVAISAARALIRSLITGNQRSRH